MKALIKTTPLDKSTTWKQQWWYLQWWRQCGLFVVDETVGYKALFIHNEVDDTEKSDKDDDQESEGTDDQNYDENHRHKQRIVSAIMTIYLYLSLVY